MRGHSVKVLKKMQRRQRLVNFKVSEEEYERIQKKADEFAAGNLSEWIRFATMHLSPASDDLTDSDSET